MALSVNAAFEEFHTRLTTNDTETEAAKSHRASIEDCLTRNFGLLRFFRTGSFGNGTNIRNYSDTDYFANIPTHRLNWDSSATLRTIKDALKVRFPTTKIYVNAPAVVVPFGTHASEKIEVIPAKYIGRNYQNYDVYEIPDGSGGWMRSSPDAHNAYVRNINTRLQMKVKPLVRFIKAWKYYNNVPVSSFYLEMLVARYADTQSAIIYSRDVHQVFQRLWTSFCYAMPDPVGVAGNISACTTEAERTEAVTRVMTAIDWADRARKAETVGNHRDAIFWWGQLYSMNFPTYG